MSRKKAAVRVRAEWDEEAGVWVAESGNLPGLVTEAETVELLFEKLRVMVPELLSYSPDLASGFLPEIRVTLLRRKGDHEIWLCPKSRRPIVVDNRIKSRHTANAIIKQAGLPKQF